MFKKQMYNENTVRKIKNIESKKPKPLIIVLDSDNSSHPPLAAALTVQWIKVVNTIDYRR